MIKIAIFLLIVLVILFTGLCGLFLLCKSLGFSDNGSAMITAGFLLLAIALAIGEKHAK